LGQGSDKLGFGKDQAAQTWWAFERSARGSGW